MNNKYLYGIPIFSHLPFSFTLNLNKHLFLSEALSIVDVQKAVTKIYDNQRMPDELEPLLQLLYSGLVNDEDFLDYGKSERMLDRLRQWISHFPETTEKEVEEYFAVHEINTDHLKGILEYRETMGLCNPAAIKAKLDEVVIGQESAKKVLSFAFYLHLLRTGYLKPEIHKNKYVDNLEPFSNLPKPNILLVGTTGSGKTLTIKTLCSIFKVPFLKIDCSSLTSSGYVGNNIVDYVKVLLKKYGEEKAKNAILFFDEFDKLSEHHIGERGSVGGVELQQEFLTLLEDKEFVLSRTSKEDGSPQEVIETDKMMLVFSGSFAGIEKIIYTRLHKNDVKNAIDEKKRTRKVVLAKWKEIVKKKKELENRPIEAIGFKKNVPTEDPNNNVNIEKEIASLLSEIEENRIEEYLDYIDKKSILEELDVNEEKLNDPSLYSSISYDDLISFGIIPELAGRLGFIAVLDKLEKADLVTIMKTASDNILSTYSNYFLLHYDKLVIHDEVYELIAEEVLKRKIGARALNGIIIHLIQDFLYIAPNKLEETFVIDKTYFRKRFPEN